MPTESMTIEQLNRMSLAARQRAILRIILPADCELTVEKYARGLASTAKIVVVSEITNLHGMVGRSSNAYKSKEREAFRAYVKLNRAPTGRTADRSGRTHGDKFYLDSRWQILEPCGSAEFPEDHPSFYTSLLGALESKGLMKISTRSLKRWRQLDFGSTMLENGNPVPSENHINVFPHAKDACNICCELDLEDKHYKASIKRHEQQGDQSSISRMSAAKDTRAAYADLIAERKRHRDEAAAAMAYHKECVTDAPRAYAEQCAAYKKFHAKGEKATSADIEAMCGSSG